MNEVFEENQILWEHCVGVGVDNTSVNIGKNNSIMTRVQEKNSSAYFMGCPCHIIHNAAGKASENLLRLAKLYVLFYDTIIIDYFTILGY